MSTKNWKNKELMENLSDKFGFKMNLNLLKEEKEMNDFPDVDHDGNTDESVEDAQEDKKEESEDDKEENKDNEDLSKVPPQLRKHVAKKRK